MIRALLCILFALAAPARAGIDCYPVEAGGSADYITTVYVGGTRAMALAWKCGATWSWVAMRWTGPDVNFMTPAAGLASLALMKTLHDAEPDFMLAEVGPYLPTPHN